MIWLLVACTDAPSSAERVRAAAVAPDVESAWAACPPADGVCRLGAVERFAAWSRCADIQHPWDDECRFRQAEAVERADDGAAAFELCASTVFEVGCATHVAGQQARRARTAAEADARWSALRAHTEDRYAFSFWRGWWRARLDDGDAPGLEACPGAVCRDAGLKEIAATVDMLAVPCKALDRPPPGWIPADSAASTAAWQQALSHHCVPSAGHPVPAPLGPGRPRR